MTHPDKRAYTFLVDGESQETQITYAELDRQARAIGSALQALDAEGERALLVYPPGLEYIAAFFACLYAGVMAVPVYTNLSNNTSATATINGDGSCVADGKNFVF